MRWQAPIGLLICAVAVVSCATPPPSSAPPRSFDFDRDTLAYANNNQWIYEFVAGPDGETVEHRPSGADHTQRCTMMSRATRQFFHTARFDPAAPPVSDDAYAALVQRVLDSDPRRQQPANEPVTIPGYADLRSLSRDKESLLKELVGGTATGYKQRGNWRMIFGFPPEHQRDVAQRLVDDLDRGHPPLVHIANFPKIDINHTVLVIGVEQTPLELRFDIYDPNNAEEPVRLVYDRAGAQFLFARTDYFRGGRAKVYEVYDGFWF